MRHCICPTKKRKKKRNKLSATRVTQSTQRQNSINVVRRSSLKGIEIQFGVAKLLVSRALRPFSKQKNTLLRVPTRFVLTRNIERIISAYAFILSDIIRII